MTTAAAVAAAAGVGATVAPVAAPKAVAVSAVRFQTASEDRAATWRAMGVPMAPSPRKAVFIIRVMSPRRIARGRASIFFFVISTVHISGMRSVHCVRAVFTALGGVNGVGRAEVSMGRAVLEHERTLAHADVEAAIAAVGYVVRAIETDRRRLPLHPSDVPAHGGDVPDA